MGRQRLYMDERGRCAMHETGFSWLAGLSLLLWALQRRQYRLALVVLVLTTGFEIAAAALELGEGGVLALFLLQFPVVGLFAHRLHAWLLERAGWRVTAEEPAAAVQPQVKAKP